jgi:thiol-disulfide isomerase/thioredoxin
VTGRLVAVALGLALGLASCVGGAGDDADDAGGRTPSVVAGAPSGASPAAPSAASPGPCPDLEPAEPVDGGLPDLELPCLGDGPDVNLADLRGVPTVVNVWAAWCTNCDREMPLFAAAQTKAGDRVRFFGVHYKADRDYGLRSEAEFGVPFPSVHDEDGDRVALKLRATAPPQTFFVTAGGRVAGREIGEITSAEQLAELVERHLGVAL